MENKPRLVLHLCFYTYWENCGGVKNHVLISGRVLKPIILTLTWSVLKHVAFSLCIEDNATGSNRKILSTFLYFGHVTHYFTEIMCRHCKLRLSMSTLDNILDHCKMCQSMQKKFSYQCYQCEYETKYRNDMRKHVRRYIGDMPFLCSYCDFKSVTKGNMLIHIRKHTGEKPYKCGFCPYTAACVKLLYRHNKKRHNVS